MIDINLVRENPNLVKDNIKKKFQNEKLILVDELRKLDEEWRRLKQRLDESRHERNKISEKINEAKKAKNENEAKILIKKIQDLPKQIKEFNEKEAKMQEKTKEILLRLPNIISKDTPIGKDASENKEVKKIGKIHKFKFPVKNHVELAETLNLIDFEKSAKTSGNGFYYIKNELAYLNQALIRFALDFMKKKKYNYIEAPLMLKSNIAFAAFDKKSIEESVYKIENEDLNLIGTAEQSLLGMHFNETISESQLPLKYFSYSMCFRKEVGAHGINEKGLWRTHQFNKIEQFIFCKPEDSEKYYKELLKNSEEILKLLKLPYRVLEICSGDLADWKYRSADLEVYRPTTGKYEEVMSLSNCTDYQARKLNIKYEDNNKDRKILHTLNDTALATSRILVAILENYQQKDGSIKVPAVLQRYTGFKIIKR